MEEDSKLRADGTSIHLNELGDIGISSIPIALRDLPVVLTLQRLTTMLSQFPYRNSTQEVRSLLLMERNLRSILLQGLELATAVDSSVADKMSSEFRRSSRCCCLDCKNNVEANFEFISRMCGLTDNQGTVRMMETVHFRLTDTCKTLESMLTELRLELIRCKYLTNAQRKTECEDMVRDEWSKAPNQPNVEEESGHRVGMTHALLDCCCALLDAVRLESSSSLLNQLIARHQNAMDLQFGPELNIPTPKCTWQDESMSLVPLVTELIEETVNKQYEGGHQLTSCARSRWTDTVQGSSAEPSEKVMPLDLLPFDIWRKILQYVEDDDTAVYSLLRICSQFRQLLSVATQFRISGPEYWRKALSKRGVDVERGCRQGLSHWECFHDYANTMACFACFSRLTDVPVTDSLTENVDAFLGRRITEARRVAYNLDVHHTSPAWPDDSVLDCRFCSLNDEMLTQGTTNLIVSLLGPPGTPYCGGRFQLWIHFPALYPFHPPRAQLLTKLFSPYFTEHGDFYFSFNKTLVGKGGGTDKTYLDGWRLHYDIGRIVEVAVRCLSLSSNFDTEDDVSVNKFAVVNHSVDELRRDNFDLFTAMAQKCTLDYAVLW